MWDEEIVTLVYFNKLVQFLCDFGVVYYLQPRTCSIKPYSGFFGISCVEFNYTLLSS